MNQCENIVFHELSASVHLLIVTSITMFVSSASKAAGPLWKHMLSYGGFFFFGELLSQPIHRFSMEGGHGK
jgi:hypothetical protein